MPRQYVSMGLAGQIRSAGPHTATALHWLTLGLSIVHPVLPCQRLNQVAQGLIPLDVVAVAHTALHLQQRQHKLDVARPQACSSMRPAAAPAALHLQD